MLTVYILLEVPMIPCVEVICPQLYTGLVAQKLTGTVKFCDHCAQLVVLILAGWPEHQCRLRQPIFFSLCDAPWRKSTLWLAKKNSGIFADISQQRCSVPSYPAPSLVDRTKLTFGLRSLRLNRVSQIQSPVKLMPKKKQQHATFVICHLK